MKFLVIFISLLLIVFGGLFSYITSNTKNIEDIKKRIGYDDLFKEQQIKMDKIIKDFSMYCFVSFVIGGCLFIAGLFI